MATNTDYLLIQLGKFKSNTPIRKTQIRHLHQTHLASGRTTYQNRQNIVKLQKAVESACSKLEINVDEGLEEKLPIRLRAWK